MANVSKRQIAQEEINQLPAGTRVEVCWEYSIYGHQYLVLRDHQNSVRLVNPVFTSALNHKLVDFPLLHHITMSEKDKDVQVYLIESDVNE